MLENLKGVWDLLFKVQLEQPKIILPIDEVTIEEPSDSSAKSPKDPNLVTRRRLIVFINIVVGLVFISSFGIISVLALRQIPIPEVLSNSFIATSGYFAAILTNFFGVHTVDS